jgi:hypothetical protein
MSVQNDELLQIQKKILAKWPTQEKYRLVKWDIISQPKQQGVLGRQNLELQNKSLLSKWLFKLYNEDGI